MNVSRTSIFNETPRDLQVFKKEGFIVNAPIVLRRRQMNNRICPLQGLLADCFSRKIPAHKLIDDRRRPGLPIHSYNRLPSLLKSPNQPTSNKPGASGNDNSHT